MIPKLNCLMPTFQENGDTAKCSSSDFRKLLYIFLLPVDVDEAWYLSTYADVKEQIDAGRIASAAEHFRLSGYMEGRFPSKPDVDESWYLKEYPDVKNAVARGFAKSAYDHFISTGASEGRMPRMIVVDAAWYMAAYPAAQQRIRRGESLDAQDDFQRHGYRNGWMPTSPSTSKSLASHSGGRKG